MMGDDELKSLAEDIKIHGLQVPIMLNHDESILVDGRNRVWACEIAGVDLTCEALPEMTDEEILDYVVSANLHRRHLTAGQKAMVATDLEPMYAEAAKNGPEVGRGWVRKNLRQIHLRFLSEHPRPVSRQQTLLVRRPGQYLTPRRSRRTPLIWPKR